MRGKRPANVCFKRYQIGQFLTLYPKITGISSYENLEFILDKILTSPLSRPVRLAYFAAALARKPLRRSLTLTYDILLVVLQD